MIFFDRTNFPFRLENDRFSMLVPHKNFKYGDSDGEIRTTSSNMVELFHSDISNTVFLLLSRKLISHYHL